VQSPLRCSAEDQENPSKPAADTETAPSSEESDEEVAFLLVVHAPSPKRSKSDNFAENSSSEQLFRSSLSNDEDNRQHEAHQQATSSTPDQNDHRSCTITEKNELESIFNDKTNEAHQQSFAQKCNTHEDAKTIEAHQQSFAQKCNTHEDAKTIPFDRFPADFVTEVQGEHLTPDVHAVHAVSERQNMNSTLEAKQSSTYTTVNENNRQSFAQKGNAYQKAENIPFDGFPAVFGTKVHGGRLTPDAAHAVSETQNMSSIQEAKESSAFTTASSASAERPLYTYRSSAYVQNLAEICHTILWDERWRVGPDHKRLLTWESGDDLSAILALSQLYDEEPLPQDLGVCPCLLCRDQKTSKQSMALMPVESVSIEPPIDTEELCSETSDLRHKNNGMENEQTNAVDEPKADSNYSDQKLPIDNASIALIPSEKRAIELTIEAEELNSKTSDLGQENNGIEQANADDEPKADSNLSDQKLPIDKEQYERSMHLFCRLFYRKGPWFRLDDIYHRYYAPRAAASSAEIGDSTDSDEEEPGTTLKSNGSAPAFGLGLNTSHANGTNGTTKGNLVVDHEALFHHLNRISDLLLDVSCLIRMGLMRSFQDEEECGKVVGQVQTDRRGILAAEERKHILNKLGGGNGKKTRRMNSGESRNNNNNASTNENEIWKQMCQQRSIFSGLPQKNRSHNNGKKLRSLLPVLRHVNDLMLDKWAASVVQACSRDAYLPASVLKPTIGHVKNSICQTFNSPDILRRRNIPRSSKSHQPSLELCIRLREAPTHALRRCARLYLCANSGPGSMRGDDKTSPWKSLKPLNMCFGESIPFSRLVPPPGVSSWHGVAYPSLNYRFGLTSCPFINAYRKCPSRPDVFDQLKQVFSSRSNFLIWEQCVELRAQVDYLIELNETSMYQERRRLRLAAMEELGDVDDTASSKVARSVTSNSQLHAMAKSAPGSSKRSVVDFLGLLTRSGRRHVVNVLASFDSVEPSSVDSFVGEAKRHYPSLEAQVENAISGHFDSLDNLPEENDSAAQSGPDLFHSDCERVLGVLAIIIIHIMLRRHANITDTETTAIASRPWLRHLCWEGCLNYVLWDIIPILERRGYYVLSVQAFEVLLFGRLGATNLLQSVGKESWDGKLSFSMPEATELAPLLLSRRARGKAYERLVLDIQHAVRKATTKEVDPCLENSGDSKQKGATEKNAKLEKSNNNKKLQENLTRFCEEIIDQSAARGSIPFSAIRVLARRLKQPLSMTLANHTCIAEVQELGLRLGELPMEQNSERDKLKYNDWAPVTDTAVANAMEQHGMNSTRCSYVGFEDNGDESATPRSLNVEELAMEYYATGRLPVSPTDDDVNEPRGGWIGWHDEGGHVRMLFRVLCSSVFGASMGCSSQERDDEMTDTQRTTVYLSRYQGAPFDLHVGYTSSNGLPMSPAKAPQGFYARHRLNIDRFLHKLSILQDQELCDLVHDHISARVERYNNQVRKNDPQLERDHSHVRTLSMLAAGFGGQQLAAIFRCFFFDYRHYSGGLPDLLLVRALYDDSGLNSYAEAAEETMTITPTSGSSGDAGNLIGYATTANANDSRLVDLGGWVGEEFHPERRAERALQQHANMLIDKDDEFLGCSKVGDSGAMGRRSNGRGKKAPFTARNRLPEPTQRRSKAMLTMPTRLELRNGQRKIVVQCMMVEVKSMNDRLDPRQEDWLNILDRFGNARVCKFSKKTQSES
jgi:hypothetical protein